MQCMRSKREGKMGYECMNIIKLIQQLLEVGNVSDNAFINFSVRSVKARVDVGI